MPGENTLRDENPHYDNELQMRAYWYRWDQIMSAPEQEMMRETLLLRLEVEDFLYREAALLDEWNLKEWIKLFAPETRYEIAPTGDPKRPRWMRVKHFSWSRTIANVSSSAWSACRSTRLTPSIRTRVCGTSTATCASCRSMERSSRLLRTS